MDTHIQDYLYGLGGARHFAWRDGSWCEKRKSSLHIVFFLSIFLTVALPRLLKDTKVFKSQVPKSDQFLRSSPSLILLSNFQNHQIQEVSIYILLHLLYWVFKEKILKMRHVISFHFWNKDLEEFLKFTEANTLLFTFNSPKQKLDIPDRLKIIEKIIYFNWSPLYSSFANRLVQVWKDVFIYF